MIVAGIGFRKGAAASAIVEAVRATLTKHGLEPKDVARLAAPALKRDEAGLASAATELGLALVFVEKDALAEADGGTLTHSQRSLDVTGVSSASEAAALASCGPEGLLFGPRESVGDVTCALASDGRPS